MNKAFFLDRDGVLNRERGNYITTVEDFEILPGVPEALSYLQKKGFLLIVITNQGGIAREFYTLETLNGMHHKLTTELAKEGVHFTEIYYCPHHPVKTKCICRKPDSGMVEKALARFNIDPGESWFIGDRDRDVGAAEKTGVRPVLVESNQDLRETVARLGV